MMMGLFVPEGAAVTTGVNTDMKIE